MITSCGTTQSVQNPPSPATLSLPSPTLLSQQENTHSPSPQPSITLEPTQIPFPSPTLTALPTTNTLLPPDTAWIRSSNSIIALTGKTLSLSPHEKEQPAPTFLVAVSTDGSHIAYLAADTPNIQVIITNVSTGQQQRFLIENRIPVTRCLRQPSLCLHAPPIFSPDSQSIAFTVVDERQRTWELHVLDVQTNNDHILKTGMITQTLDPVGWMPEGLLVQQLLFGTGALPENLALVDLVNGSVQSLRQEEHLEAVLSPDETKIALVVGSLPISEIPEQAIVLFDRRTGQEKTLVPSAKGLIGQIRWSPDGDELLYTRSATYNTPVTTISVITSDGSEEKIIDLESRSTLPFRDAAWYDSMTLLLLTAASDQQLHLYTLPLDSPNSSIQEVGVVKSVVTQENLDQIVYVPEQ